MKIKNPILRGIAGIWLLVGLMGAFLGAIYCVFMPIEYFGKKILGISQFVGWVFIGFMALIFICCGIGFGNSIFNNHKAAKSENEKIKEIIKTCDEISADPLYIREYWIKKGFLNKEISSEFIPVVKVEELEKIKNILISIK